MTAVVVGVSLAIGLAGLVFGVCQRVMAVRQLRKLKEMLRRAMDGSFSERQFDETTLSAFEARFAQYLSGRAAADRKLEEEQGRVAQLSSDIAHQVRTPVANIRLYAQLLEEQPLPEGAAPCVRALLAQGDKLESLTGALFKASRLEAGIIALHPEQGRLLPLVRRAVSQYTPAARAKRIALHMEDEDAEAVFDPRWTEEALCNLIDNAVKYTPAGGSVEVSVRSYELFCRVTVSDTGPGIPESEHPKIFRRFYRAPAAEKVPGSGLGLYLAREIAAGEGGYLKVESRVGEGSRFSIYLPREKRESLQN